MLVVFGRHKRPIDVNSPTQVLLNGILRIANGEEHSGEDIVETLVLVC